MSGPEFFQTRMGRKFYESDVPAISDSLSKIAKELQTLTAGKEGREQQLLDIKAKALSEKIHGISSYVDETFQAWDNAYKAQGTIPYNEAKSVLAVLIRLLRKP